MLVIDELAALTAYADLDVRREAGRMLAEILTQGRALGVVVVACVQDPRKDVVAMRGLFTQTVALRLRSAEETVMVLGDGMSHARPGAPDQPHPSRHRRGWSTTPAPPTGSAPTTGPTRSSGSVATGTPPRSRSTPRPVDPSEDGRAGRPASRRRARGHAHHASHGLRGSHVLPRREATATDVEREEGAA